MFGAEPQHRVSHTGSRDLRAPFLILKSVNIDTGDLAISGEGVAGMAYTVCAVKVFRVVEGVSGWGRHVEVLLLLARFADWGLLGGHVVYGIAVNIRTQVVCGERR